MNVKRGDRLTDCQQVRTSYLVHQGTQGEHPTVIDENGGLHRLDDCQAPSEDYE
ncbi:MAG: hypothetical protein F6K00_34490 [Leptolyngbya sp. SIOISBB]|nr:hypothetical protein [Leptolyngbya sp. SIOISBB]